MFQRMPSPSALRTFEAAARLGSFKAAAQELSVTPTAISHQIRALERRIGLGLFARHARAVELTAAGRRLAEATSQGFSQIQEALEELSEGEEVLTIATTPAFAAQWLAPRLGGFQKAFPDLRVRIEADTKPVELRRDRRVDIAIRYGRGTFPDLHAVPLQSETFGAYAAPAYLARLDDLDEAAFFETTWTQPGLSGMTWAQWFATAGIGCEIDKLDLRRFDQEHHVLQCGIAAQGCILASSILVSDMVARDFLRPFRPEVRLEGMRYTALATRERSEARKVRHFLAWIRTEFDRSA